MCRIEILKDHILLAQLDFSDKEKKESEIVWKSLVESTNTQLGMSVRYLTNKAWIEGNHYDIYRKKSANLVKFEL